VQFSVETVREVARIAGETQLGEISLEHAGARLTIKRAALPISAFATKERRALYTQTVMAS
jgi:hypothetical protein